MKLLNVLMRSKMDSGVSRMALDYGRALKHEGVDIQFLCAANTPMAEVISAEFPIFPIHSPRFRLSRKTVIDAKSVISSVKPDVIITHNNRESLNVRATRVFSDSLVPIIRAAHSEHPRYIRHTADAFIAVSEGVSSALRSKGIPEHAIRICDNFTSVAIGDDHFSSPGRISNKPVIGFLGRFANEKNPFLFIDTIEELRKRGVETKGLIGGDGKARWRKAVSDAIQAVPDSDIECLGWVQDVDEFFKGIDVLVVPSREEPFGLVMLEAMARGVPVVATRTSGSKVIIKDGVNGFETPHDCHALADAVARLVSDCGLREKVVANGLENARYFSLERQAPALLKAIEELSALSR